MTRIKEIIEFIAHAVEAGCVGAVYSTGTPAVVPTGEVYDCESCIDGTQIRQCGFEVRFVSKSAEGCYDALEKTRSVLAALDCSMLDIISIAIKSEPHAVSRRSDGSYSCRFDASVRWRDVSLAGRADGQCVTVDIGGLMLAEYVKTLEVDDSEVSDRDNSYTDIDGKEHVAVLRRKKEIKAKLSGLDAVAASALSQVLSDESFDVSLASPYGISGEYACLCYSMCAEANGSKPLYRCDFTLREVF